jgi:hypothetical protein
MLKNLHSRQCVIWQSAFQNLQFRNQIMYLNIR